MEEHFHRKVTVAFLNFFGILWMEVGLQSQNTVFNFLQGNVNGALRGWGSTL